MPSSNTEVGFAPVSGEGSGPPGPSVVLTALACVAVMVAAAGIIATGLLAVHLFVRGALVRPWGGAPTAGTWTWSAAIEVPVAPMHVDAFQDTAVLALAGCVVAGMVGLVWLYDARHRWRSVDRRTGRWVPWASVGATLLTVLLGAYAAHPMATGAGDVVVTRTAWVSPGLGLLAAIGAGCLVALLTGVARGARRDVARARWSAPVRVAGLVFASVCVIGAALGARAVSQLPTPEAIAAADARSVAHPDIRIRRGPKTLREAVTNPEALRDYIAECGAGWRVEHPAVDGDLGGRRPFDSSLAEEIRGLAPEQQLTAVVAVADQDVELAGEVFGWLVLSQADRVGEPALLRIRAFWDGLKRPLPAPLCFRLAELPSLDFADRYVLVAGSGASFANEVRQWVAQGLLTDAAIDRLTRIAATAEPALSGGIWRTLGEHASERQLRELCRFPAADDRVRVKALIETTLARPGVPFELGLAGALAEPTWHELLVRTVVSGWSTSDARLSDPTARALLDTRVGGSVYAAMVAAMGNSRPQLVREWLTGKSEADRKVIADMLVPHVGAVWTLLDAKAAPSRALAVYLLRTLAVRLGLSERTMLLGKAEREVDPAVKADIVALVAAQSD